jgi:hypothetical protein
VPLSRSKESSVSPLDRRKSRDAVDDIRNHLLRRVARSGWTEELARQFESEFGPELRRLVVLHLFGLGLVEFRFDPDRAREVLSAKRLELLDNTLTDLWLSMLRGLVSKYVRDRASGSVHQEFLAYVSGVVRNTLVENARHLGLIPKCSFVDMLRDLCRSSGDDTRRRHVSSLKYHMESWARREVVSLCPPHLFDQVYRHRGHVIDYFFEVHVPASCQIVSKGPRTRVLRALLDAFGEEEYSRALTYRGKVNPSPAFSVLVDVATTAADEGDRFVDFVAELDPVGADRG